MHLYLRLMKRSAENTYSESEQADLRSFLSGGPGVLVVKTIERHLRGGYAVALDVEDHAPGPLSDYVSSIDLMLVL
jgi:hypothetical protein